MNYRNIDEAFVTDRADSYRSSSVSSAYGEKTACLGLGYGTPLPRSLRQRIRFNCSDGTASTCCQFIRADAQASLRACPVNAFAGGLTSKIDCFGSTAL